MKQKTLTYTYYWGEGFLSGGFCPGAYIQDPPTIKITLC